jgi:predicted PurR-regulated permease PerM
MRLERHIVFWIAAFLVFVGLLWLLREILLPFIVGAVLAYLLDPLANRLTRHGLSRLVAVLVIMIGFVILFAGALVLIAPRVLGQLQGVVGAAEDLITHAPQYWQKLQSLISVEKYPWLRGFLGDSSEGLPSFLTNGSIQQYLKNLLSTLLNKGMALLSLFSLLVITPVVSFYLLLDWNRVLKSFDDLIPVHQRDTVRGLVREINKALSGYLHGQVLVCVILGAYYAIVLSLAHLPYGLLIGVVGGFLSFIPYVGSLTALVISFGVALATFYPEWTHILLIVGIVLVGQFLEGNVLAPKLVGESVGLHPVWLIFALLAFGYLFGFVGLLLAVPLAATAGVLIRFAVRRYRASPLYTGNTLG